MVLTNCSTCIPKELSHSFVFFGGGRGGGGGGGGGGGMNTAELQISTTCRLAMVSRRCTSSPP